MLFYVASSWKNRKAARELMIDLELSALPLRSSATWLSPDYDETGETPLQIATRDTRDIRRTHIFIFLESPFVSVGRFWELGYAHARGLHTIYYLPKHMTPSEVTTIFTELANYRAYSHQMLMAKLWDLSE